MKAADFTSAMLLIGLCRIEFASIMRENPDMFGISTPRTDIEREQVKVFLWKPFTPLSNWSLPDVLWLPPPSRREVFTNTCPNRDAGVLANFRGGKRRMETRHRTRKEKNQTGSNLETRDPHSVATVLSPGAGLWQGQTDQTEGDQAGRQAPRDTLYSVHVYK